MGQTRVLQMARAGQRFMMLPLMPEGACKLLEQCLCMDRPGSLCVKRLVEKPVCGLPAQKGHLGVAKMLI